MLLFWVIMLCHFSYYSYHGPVFRAILTLRGISFISYCNRCGNSQTFSWDEIGEMSCSCNIAPNPLVVSGPLHSFSFLTEMQDLAGQWGWTGNGAGKHLDTLMKLMIDENDPVLPFGYTKLDEVPSRAKVNSPPLDTVLRTLHKEGYAASRSHIAFNAIKTNCPMVDCVRIVKEIQQLSPAADKKLYRVNEVINE